MKNMHFCTDVLLRKIKEARKGEGDIIETYRTGWTPGIYPNDIINLNENNPDGKDFFICKGKVLSVIPLKHKDILGKGLEELERYKRKFHPDHWFFNITIELNPEVIK